VTYAGQTRQAEEGLGWERALPRSPQRSPFMYYCNKRQQTRYVQLRGAWVYTTRLSVARKGFPRPNFCFFVGCAPSTGVGTSREATYHGRLLSGNSQDAPPGSRREGSILASVAASRSRESRDGGRAWPRVWRSMQANALPAGAVPLLQAAPKRDGLTSTIRVQKARLKP
jgi:hypothetical protein